MSAGMPILEIKDGVLPGVDATASAPLSFVVRPGETVALVPDNADDGTSVLRTFLGFEPLAQGYVSVDGEPIFPPSAHLFRRDMTYLPADFSMPFATVEEMAKSVFLLKSNEGNPFRKHDLNVYWHTLDITPDTYTLPLRDVAKDVVQRILLASAAMSKRPVVLLDRPTSCQDDRHARMVADFLHSGAFAQSAVLVSTDDPRLSPACSRTIRLCGSGKIEQHTEKI